MTAVAIFADAHLGFGGPGGAGEPLARQLDELEAGAVVRTLFLGDLFHVWIGHRKYETEDVRTVVAAVRRLTERGVRTEYVEGNRDFFLCGSPYEQAFDRVADEVAFAHDGVRYLAVHGDGLNDADRQYRFWRWLSKSPPSRFFFRRLPGPVARRLVHGTERRLARTNFKHRVAIPEAPIRRYAEERLAEGHDVLLLGHFHEPTRFTVRGGEVRIVDAWFRTRRPELLGTSA